MQTTPISMWFDSSRLEPIINGTVTAMVFYPESDVWLQGESGICIRKVVIETRSDAIELFNDERKVSRICSINALEVRGHIKATGDIVISDLDQIVDKRDKYTSMRFELNSGDDFQLGISMKREVGPEALFSVELPVQTDIEFASGAVILMGSETIYLRVIPGLANVMSLAVGDDIVPLFEAESHIVIMK